MTTTPSNIDALIEDAEIQLFKIRLELLNLDKNDENECEALSNIKKTFLQQLKSKAEEVLQRLQHLKTAI